MSPMGRYLDQLIDEGQGEAVICQLCFKPAGVMQAGALARGPVDGTYKLGIGAQATKDTPGDFKPGAMLTCSVVFEPDAVMQVITFLEHSGIVSPAAMPSGSGPANPYGAPS